MNKKKKAVNSIPRLKPKSKPNEVGSIWKRKKEIADMELFRLFRKPKKRNGASFF